tara:strand:- start:9168 stop:9737 length:570 start_codon:yes stop_codon:yes gene_type:complete
MSLWDKLSHDIIQHIYEYDTTYREKLNESLKFIKHVCPTCCCDGGEKNRYRHHYNVGTFAYTFWDWEWRRRNACPKHNPEDFDKDGNQTRYNLIFEHNELDYPVVLQHNITNRLYYYDLSTTYYNYEIRTTGRVGWNGTIDYNIIMLVLWIFSTRNKDIYPSPIKTYSRKKLIGTRFMDMAHEQRPIKA